MDKKVTADLSVTRKTCQVALYTIQVLMSYQVGMSCNSFELHFVHTNYVASVLSW